MKRDDREELVNDPGISGRFVQAEGDVLYRWNDPSKRKLRYWQLAFLSLAVGSIVTSIASVPTDKVFEAISQINFEFVRDLSPVFLPLIALFIGFLYSQTKRDVSSTKDSFQDIDLRAQGKEQLLSVRKLRAEIDNLKSGLIQEAKEEPAKPKDHYEDYVLNLIQTLDKHVTLAEEKASKLLDTGTKYLRRGIYFYIASIIVWQLAFHYWGGTTYMIYGIVSCSIAFLVVEFLAAWFLKQYRSFIESSMQFMKVRSVFDRYLLAYYSLKEFSDGSTNSETRSLMLKVLEEKAGWPDSTTLPADVNHMVQMFSSVSEVLEKIKPFKINESGK